MERQENKWKQETPFIDEGLNGEYYLQFDDLGVTSFINDFLAFSGSLNIFRRSSSWNLESGTINGGTSMELSVNGTNTKHLTYRLIKARTEIPNQTPKGSPERCALTLNDWPDHGIFSRQVLQQISHLRTLTVKSLPESFTLRRHLRKLAI